MMSTTARPPRFPSRCRVSAFTPVRSLSEDTCGPPGWGAPAVVPSLRPPLADALERAVALDLVDPEAAALQVAARGEPDGEPEDRRLDLRLGDELAHLGAAPLFVLARRGDGVDDDLRRDVRRGAEELAVPVVRLLVGLDDRVARGDREERVVRARDLPIR